MFGEPKICGVCRATKNKDGVDCRTCPFYRCNHSENENQNSDNVNHPFHYQGKYECIDEMIALFGVDAVRCFCMCNVYKYRFRADRKNGSEDIKKAEWYMEKLMELNQEAKREKADC